MSYTSNPTLFGWDWNPKNPTRSGGVKGFLANKPPPKSQLKHVRLKVGIRWNEFTIQSGDGEHAQNTCRTRGLIVHSGILLAGASHHQWIFQIPVKGGR